ncbi:MAG: enoyl-CoA hydratase, partial [Gammaproteobacteria bacterium]
MAHYKHLNWLVNEGIGRLELARPEKKNAINNVLCEEIEDVFRK